MTKNIANISTAIDATIAARKQLLPAIEAERNRINHQAAQLRGLQARLSELLAICADQGVCTEVRVAQGAIAASIAKLSGYQDSLAELKAEFTRNTLNIGVSGAARTGKSTTLQRFTGLSDSQIPSGGLNPVTAVRSEIYNSSRNEAVVTFKSEHEFIEGYVRPHAENVNAYLEGSKLVIDSMAALKAIELPDKLGANAVSASTDSLKRLREAQRSAATYEGFLGSSPVTVPLDDVRAYVTYPSPDQENNETAGGAPADRRYLAVKLAEVFCQFPNLGSAKVGLVDLPGLGEIGNSASSIHLKGLEDKVDQIFLVMRPTAAKAFTDNEVACNLDQLLEIQPAVRRGDLIVAGINKDAVAGQDAADNLRAHFNAVINKHRTDGGYDVLEYCAVDDADVALLFSKLLDRLATQLPAMDQQKFDHCMSGMDLSSHLAGTVERLSEAMDRVLRAIPSPDRVMKERVDSIKRSVVGSLGEYAEELEASTAKKSEQFKAFVTDVERIHESVAQRINNGLFRRDEDEWNELTSGARDYYNLYRDEAKRIRYEIIDAYRGLDRFYLCRVDIFKRRVLNILVKSCGLYDYFKFTADETAEGCIARVRAELGDTLQDRDLDNALAMLSSVSFNFYSNVFLQIEKHLDDLANPRETASDDSLVLSMVNSKRIVLGGKGSSERKQDKMRGYLRADARAANDAILKALKSEDDRFNKYLAVSIDFFNNYLFGKDEDNFKQVVIRGIINNYREFVLPDAEDASKSPVGILARDIKASVRALGENPPHVDSQVRNAMPASQRRKKVDGFVEGQVLAGKVTKVQDNGCFVTVGNHYGFVPKRQISQRRVDNPKEFVGKGDAVRVKVIRIDRDTDSLVLSIRQAG